MDQEISKLTSKGQTTIPAPLRKSLQWQSGDELLFRKKGKQIIVEKLNPVDVEYYRAIQSSFATEWESEEDNEAFNDL